MVNWMEANCSHDDQCWWCYKAKEQISALAGNLSRLNAVYGNMLEHNAGQVKISLRFAVNSYPHWFYNGDTKNQQAPIKKKMLKTTRKLKILWFYLKSPGKRWLTSCTWVLTAILALNVSAEIVEAYSERLKRSLEKSSQSIEVSNTNLFDTTGYIKLLQTRVCWKKQKSGELRLKVQKIFGTLNSLQLK